MKKKFTLNITFLSTYTPPYRTYNNMTTVYIKKNFAPGEARTPDLRISMSILTYKYDALTDCATGA